MMVGLMSVHKPGLTGSATPCLTWGRQPLPGAALPGGGNRASPAAADDQRSAGSGPISDATRISCSCSSHMCSPSTTAQASKEREREGKGGQGVWCMHARDEQQLSQNRVHWSRTGAENPASSQRPLLFSHSSPIDIMSSSVTATHLSSSHLASALRSLAAHTISTEPVD